MTFSKIPKRVVADRVNTLAVLLALGQGDKVIATSAGESPLSYARLKEKYPEEIKRSKVTMGSIWIWKQLYLCSLILLWDGSHLLPKIGFDLRNGGIAKV